MAEECPPPNMYIYIYDKTETCPNPLASEQGLALSVCIETPTCLGGLGPWLQPGYRLAQTLPTEGSLLRPWVVPVHRRAVDEGGKPGECDSLAVLHLYKLTPSIAEVFHLFTSLKT